MATKCIVVAVIIGLIHCTDDCHVLRAVSLWMLRRSVKEQDDSESVVPASVGGTIGDKQEGQDFDQVSLIPFLNSTACFVYDASLCVSRDVGVGCALDECAETNTCCRGQERVTGLRPPI